MNSLRADVVVRPLSPTVSGRTITEGNAPVLAWRGLLATDIEAYGHRSGPDQHEVQRAYASAIRHAAVAADLRLDDCLRQPAGDGEIVVLPDGVHEPRVLGVLLPMLAAELHEYNRHRERGFRLRLRVTVHRGLIHLDGPIGFPGHAAVTVARLLDCAPVRKLLRDRPNINLAAVVSAELYDEIVRNRYEGLRPELFRRTQVDEPAKGFSASAWLYAPEEDVTRRRRRVARFLGPYRPN